MQSTSVQFSPVKDGRRILGEKDSNACLSAAHHAKQALSVTSTPVKQALFSNISPKKLLPSPIFAGQKRTRDQVDEIEVNDGSVQVPRELRVESPPSTVEHESQQVSYNPTAMWDISNQNGINWLTPAIAESRVGRDGSHPPSPIIATETRPTPRNGYN